MVGAFEAIIIFLLLIAIGLLVSKLGWANEHTGDFITKLVMNVTLPATIVYSFLNRITKAELMDAWLPLVICIAGVFLGYAAAVAAGAIFKTDKKRRGVFSVLFSSSNSGFIGFPVALVLFGDTGFIYAVIYFISSNLLANTFCYIAITRDGAKGVKHSAAFWVKKYLKPPIISVIVGITLVMCGVQLPEFVNKALSYMECMTTPLSLMLIGIIMYNMGFKNMRFERDIALASIGKFLVCPLIMLLFCRLFGASALQTQIFCIQACLPSMVSTVIFAKAAGADSDFAAKCVVWTTLISLVVLPIYVLLFGI